MKRALLWLGPLACLALACLCAYAWFARDPLAAAFERIEVGMTTEDAIAIVGRPSDIEGTVVEPVITPGNCEGNCEGWRNNRKLLYGHGWMGSRFDAGIHVRDGRVETKVLIRKETIAGRIFFTVCNPSPLWNPRLSLDAVQ